MRTKEKFYKNLKGYISKEDRIERIELRDVKTLDRLVKDANKASDKLKAAANRVIDDEILFEDALDELDVAIADVETKKELLENIKKENQKRVDAGQKKIDASKKVVTQKSKKSDAVGKAYEQSVRVAKDAKSDAISLLGQIRTAIDSFESGAKALGVDVSNKVSQYNSAADKLEAATLRLKDK